MLDNYPVFFFFFLDFLDFLELAFFLLSVIYLAIGAHNLDGMEPLLWP
jgi:hypothetical protein